MLKRPKTGDALCKECFYWAFETEIHFTITKAKLFKPGDYVAIGASGGKDSTVLAHVMKTLNERFNYGLKLVLLSIGMSSFRYPVKARSSLEIGFVGIIVISQVYAKLYLHSL